jgi:hypothetical protein
MPAAASLLVAPDDLAVLRRLARSTRLPAVLARRARILLLAADGVANTQIAHRVGSRARPCWPADAGMRRGLEGLADRPRPGRPQTVRRRRRAEILQVTLSPPPPGLGSRTGRLGCWPASWASAATRSPESGARPTRSIGSVVAGTSTAQPFTWTKSADEILAKLGWPGTAATNRQTFSVASLGLRACRERETGSV